MHPFPSYSLGARVPDSPHAVCCSLPTLNDVIGYEEKNPEVRRHVLTGYPRFVEHTFLSRLAEHVRGELGLHNHTVVLGPSRRAAENLRTFLVPAKTSLHEWGPLSAVALPPGEDFALRSHRFFQHTGCGVSSRQAEDLLLQAGLLEAAFPEPPPPGAPEGTVLRALQAACPEADPDYFLLSRSGMNAFFSAFTAARQIQEPKGKTIWIQLGWLYLDTIRVLETFLGPEDRHIALTNACDPDALEELFARDGSRIAGVITETPTNPLLQTANLARIRELCDRHGALLFADPTLASFHNVDVYPYADVVLHSLTKYFGHRGNVMMGLAAFNPERNGFASDWLRLARASHEAPYKRDLEQLAVQIGNSQKTVEAINKNTLRVAAFLENHPRVRRVHWAYGETTAAGYKRLARGPDRPGGILTLDLDMPLADFYDAAPFVKGPSFGTTFTMMCPFMYLAHYDLVSNPEGRRHLQSHGLNPELVRLSLGTEPVEDIIEGLSRALGTG